MQNVLRLVTYTFHDLLSRKEKDDGCRNFKYKNYRIKSVFTKIFEVGGNQKVASVCDVTLCQQTDNFDLARYFIIRTEIFNIFLFFSTSTLKEQDTVPSVTKPVTTLIPSEIWGICVRGKKERLISTSIISFNHSWLRITLVREEVHVSPNTTVYSLLHFESHFVLAERTVAEWRAS